MSNMKRTGLSSRKGHISAFTGDLIALGSKPGSSKPSLRHSDEPKSSTSFKQGGTGSSSLGAPPAKKPKLAAEGAGGLFSDPIRVTQVTQLQPLTARGGQGSGSKSPAGGGIGAAQVIEVRPTELVAAVQEARAAGNDAKAARVLAGALKQLRLSRLKPDPTLNVALTTLGREDSELFNNPPAIEGLIAVLKREPAAIFKAKGNPIVYTLASQLLLLALKDSYNWPEAVAKVFIEDSLGDRLWVDLEQSRKLVDNICTMFQTRPYVPGSSSNSSSGSGSGSAGTATPAPKTGPASETGSSAGQAGKNEGEGGGSVASVEGDKSDELSLGDVEVAPRFSPSTLKSLKAYILQLVGEQMGRHSIPADVSRNLLRFLTTAAGLPDIRLRVAQKIEGWIQNPKLGKQCQDLLMTVAVNCHTHSQEDLRVIDALINVRLKTKLFSNQFVTCIKELIASHPANLETVLRGVVGNELGQLRSPSNMAIIAMTVHMWPDEAAKLLGVVFQEFLTRKEDYLKALRGFLREVIRQVRNEFNFLTFSRSLMQERQEVEFTQLDSTHKERMALSVADLITCSCLLTSNMLIREAYNGYSKGEKAMVPQLKEFFATLGLIQRDAVWWVHTIVPGAFRPQPVDYKACLKKCLFLEPAEAYCSKDNWPPESDRSLILHMMTEAVLMEDTLMRVLVIGLARELPLSPADALDIADKLVARAANAHTEDIPRLPVVERKEIFSVIFDITAYRAPPNIQLPDGYKSPSLAISKLYWKGWILLLVLSAFNPKTIGALSWSEYPPLCGMMEMVMTNTYTFPPSMTLVTTESGSVESKDGAIARELQLSRSEKEAILEYEGHLASSSTSSASPQGTTITEANSFLLNQVTLLNPKGPARRLPPSVIELVKTVNRSLKLGKLLCRCRSPDFLLSIIKRQGTLESMKWLTELVESSHSSLEVLPTPCLCEFLMASYQEQGSSPSEAEADPSSHRAQYKRKKSAKDKAQGRHRQLVTQLHSLLMGPQSSPQTCSEVVEYFFEKLTLSQLTPRALVLKALQEILGKGREGVTWSGGRGELSDDTEDEELKAYSLKSGEWLVNAFPSLPHFASILPRVCPLLLQACLVETNLHCLQSFILFLTRYSPQEKLYEVSIGISQIIVDRFLVIRKLFQAREREGETLGSDADVTLSSLLSMLRVTLEKAIHSQTMPQVSSSSDFLLVNFPSGQKTILHTALIQAIFLLLTCSPPTNQSDYTYLLDIWFPATPVSQPEAYTVDSKERVTLPPNTLLNYMVYANNKRVVESAVQATQPQQLCAFLQLFGIPVENVEKVLKRLDAVVESTPVEEVFSEGVGDPVLLSQSIHVQMLRGVKSGMVFLTYLQGLANLPQKPLTNITTLLELSVEQTSVARQPQPIHMKPEHREIPRIPQERTEQLLLQIFTPSLSRIGASPQEVQKLRADLEQGLKNLVILNLASKVVCSTVSIETQSLNADISGLIAALHKLITASSIRRQFLEGLVRNSFSIILLRLVTRIQKMKKTEGISAGLFKATLQYLFGALESLRAPSSSALISFQAAVKSCAEQLGVKRPSESGDVVQRWSKVVRKTCANVSEARNPFENEGALVRTCQDLTQGSVVLIEDIVHVLAKRAISLGKEAKCIEILSKIRSYSNLNPPIVLQYSPETFVPNQTELSNGDGDREHREPSETMDFSEQGSTDEFTTAHTLDLSGLLVDWLELLDPETVSLCPESIQQLVFSSSRRFATPTSSVRPSSSPPISSQGYLLARLTHESSWVTVTNTISALLDTSQLKERVDPSAVLDFLWACLHNPSLWQGRVKKEAIINSFISMGIDEESQLILTPSQLECLVDCILKEAAATCVGMKGLTDSSSLEKGLEVPLEAKTLLYSRLPLLMCCLHGNQLVLKAVIKHLQTHSSYPSLGWQLLVHLYYANERVILLVDHSHPLSIAALDTTTPCKLDTELHDLLSAMADARPGQESMQKMTNAALLCRKITICHPALMIRQLPMLGWLLRGRAHLNPGEFRNRNHKQVFINSFVILDLLQPLVFEDSQSDALDACLEPFFDFLKNQCKETKKYQSLVARFSDFLVQYAQYNRDRAAALIHRHLDILRALSETHQSKKSSLKPLVECFLRRKDGEGAAGRELLNGQDAMMIVPPLMVGHTLSHEQVMPFLKKLEQGQLREDILKVLQDLDETSLHSVGILKHFVPELCRIIQDKEPTSCKLAHNLLLRHLKQSPSTVDDFLPAFIGCLESHDHNVVMAAVGSIPDLVLLCKAKDASHLLWHLFCLATQFRYDCTTELIRAIEACTQHTFR